MTDPKQKQKELLEKTMKEQARKETNKACFNCGRGGPQSTVVLTTGTFVCSQCGGLQRGLGHVVKGISMSEFKAQEVDNVKKTGNAVARKIWLATMDQQTESRIQAERDDPKAMANYLKMIYVDKRFYRPQQFEAPAEAPASNGGAAPNANGSIARVAAPPSQPRRQGSRLPAAEAEPAPAPLKSAPAAPKTGKEKVAPQESVPDLLDSSILNNLQPEVAPPVAAPAPAPQPVNPFAPAAVAAASGPNLPKLQRDSSLGTLMGFSSAPAPQPAAAAAPNDLFASFNSPAAAAPAPVTAFPGAAMNGFPGAPGGVPVVDGTLRPANASAASASVSFPGPAATPAASPEMVDLVFKSLKKYLENVVTKSRLPPDQLRNVTMSALDAVIGGMQPAHPTPAFSRPKGMDIAPQPDGPTLTPVSTHGSPPFGYGAAVPTPVNASNAPVSNRGPLPGAAPAMNGFAGNAAFVPVANGYGAAPAFAPAPMHAMPAPAGPINPFAPVSNGNAGYAAPANGDFNPFAPVAAPANGRADAGNPFATGEEYGSTDGPGASPFAPVAAPASAAPAKNNNALFAQLNPFDMH